MDSTAYETAKARTLNAIEAGAASYADVGLPAAGALPSDWTADMDSMTPAQKADYLAALAPSSVEWVERIKAYLTTGS